MTYTPPPLAALRRYLSEQTGREPKYFSIARTCGGSRACAGYHLGKDQIYGPGGQGDRDYSIARPRDKAGLSNARSAIDINLGAKRLAEMNAYLVAEAKAGNARDLVEVIGPDTNGRAYDWRKPNWERIGPRPKGDSHEWHTHLSFHRDSEERAKVPLFEGFFGARTPPEPEPEDPTVNPDQVKQLQTLLNSLGANLVVDGLYGPLTDAALEAAVTGAPELARQLARQDVAIAEYLIEADDAEVAHADRLRAAGDRLKEASQ